MASCPGFDCSMVCSQPVRVTKPHRHQKRALNSDFIRNYPLTTPMLRDASPRRVYTARSINPKWMTGDDGGKGSMTIVRSCRSPNFTRTCLPLQKKNESLAISSVYRDFLLSGFLSLCPGIPAEFHRWISTPGASTFYLHSCIIRLTTAASSPRHAQMHIRPMHVLGFPKGGGDPYDGQTFDLPPELQQGQATRLGR